MTLRCLAVAIGLRDARILDSIVSFDAQERLAQDSSGHEVAADAFIDLALKHRYPIEDLAADLLQFTFGGNQRRESLRSAILDEAHESLGLLLSRAERLTSQSF